MPDNNTPGENPRVRAQRRASLLAAARGLFLEHGVDAVTIEQVADRAFVTRRTVYRYFPSRDHLALAIEAQILDRWAGEAEKRASGLSGTGAEQLAGYFDHLEQLVDAAADEVRFTRVFDATPLGHLDDSPEGEVYARAILRLNAPMIRILEAGVADGSLAVPPPLDLTAATIVNGYLALAQRVYGREHQIAVEQGISPRPMLTQYATLVRSALG